MTFRLVTFGKLALLNDEGKHVFYPQNALLGLCYLLSIPGATISRSGFARFIWDSVESSVALSNLRKLISRLEKRHDETGQRLLIFQEGMVRADLQSLECDFLEFEHPKSSNTFDLLERIARVCHFDFLAELDGVSNSANDWILNERGKYLRIFSGGLLEALPFAQSCHHMALIDEVSRRLFASPNELLSKALQQPKPDLRGTQGWQTFAAIGRTFKQGRERLDAQARPQHSAPPNKSVRIALLPPTNANVSETFCSLAIAMIEDVAIGLCGLRDISIVAPYTARKLRFGVDKAALLARHDILYVLDTSIVSFQSANELFVQLISVADDAVLWAERFHPKSELLAQRRQISSQICVEVTTHIQENEQERPYLDSTSTAYKSYLEGNHLLNLLTLPDIRRARKAFREALRATPTFSPASSSLARTYLLEWIVTARGDIELLKEAERHAIEAVSADGSLASAYRELGVVKLYRGEVDESAEALARAEVLSPQYADAIASYADTLVHACKPAEALVKIERAIDLNPLSPDFYLWTAAGANYCLERYQEALSYIVKMEDRGPAHRLSAASWAMLGDKKQASIFRRKALETNPHFEIEKWLAVVPFKEQQQKDHYRAGLQRAGF